MRVFLDLSFASESLSLLLPLIESSNIGSIVLTGPAPQGIHGKLRSYYDPNGYGETWQNYENFHNYKDLIYDQIRSDIKGLWLTPEIIAWGNFLDALKSRKDSLYLTVSGQSLPPEFHDELEGVLPKCIEFEDETHETNMQLLDYTLFQKWEGSELKRQLLKDPDLFVRAAIKILGGSAGDCDVPDNSEFHNSEEDLMSRLEQLRLDSASA